MSISTWVGSFAAGGGPPPPTDPLEITGEFTDAAVGVAYSFTPTTTGGTTPYTFARTGRLPPGISFSTSTGALTGTPTV